MTENRSDISDQHPTLSSSVTALDEQPVASAASSKADPPAESDDSKAAENPTDAGMTIEDLEDLEFLIDEIEDQIAPLA